MLSVANNLLLASIDLKRLLLSGNFSQENRKNSEGDMLDEYKTCRTVLLSGICCSTTII